MSATGRKRRVGVDRDVSAKATCYAGAAGRERPLIAVRLNLATEYKLKILRLQI